MNRPLIAGLIAGLLSGPAAAIEPFVVRDIRIEGIQRTEAGTVFSYLPIRVGERLDDEKASEAIRALFATGFFTDVRIESEGDVLVVVIAERPAIARIDFVGLKEFDQEQLKKGLREIGLGESRIFDRSLLEKAEQELKRQYLARGKYAVRVLTTVTPLERNRVSISFSIDEGEVAKIRQINIVGAEAIRESELLDLFQLRTPNFMSWFTRSDQYSRQKLAADLESLRSHYLDQGFLEFAIDSTQVSISADRKDIFITISIREGERFTVSDVKVAGELVIPDEEYRKLVTLSAGEIFSRAKLNASSKAIADRLGNEGYAFANVNAAPEIDREKKTVAFTLFVDPGRRAYVRRINVTGNTRTGDAVIRREMRQMESAWYDAGKINRSRERVDRLGFFTEVTVDTPPVPGTTDQVDVNINVEEKPTGSLMLGIGFSSAEKLVVSGSVSQDNLFGTGRNLAVQVNSGKINRVYSVSYTNPYFTIDGISQGFDVYHRTNDPTSLSVGSFRTKTNGGGMRFGLPIGETESLGTGLSVESTEITVFDDSPQRYKDFVATFGDQTTTVMGTVNWARDTRDSGFYPTRGGIRRIGTEFGLPGGDLRYYRATLNAQQFVPLSRDYTLWLNGEYGHANGVGGKPLPFFKNYYAGGIGSVRGYDTASLGPKVVNPDGTLSNEGGNRRVVANLEFLTPFPGTGRDRAVRLGYFVDGGMVYGKDQSIDLGQLRYSAGVALAWYSPIGPLKFSLAKPLNAVPGDRTQRFQFQLGSVF
jgi:outer membrane protein insertion porin family